MTTQPYGVRVTPRHERRARRGTKRRRVEIIEAQPVLRQPIDVGSLDEPTKTPDLRKTDIVQEKNENIGSTFLWPNWFRPPLHAVFITSSNLAPKLLIRRVNRGKAYKPQNQECDDR